MAFIKDQYKEELAFVETTATREGKKRRERFGK